MINGQPETIAEAIDLLYLENMMDEADTEDAKEVKC